MQTCPHHATFGTEGEKKGKKNNLGLFDDNRW